MKNIVIIPTYWNVPGKSTDHLFDHPTPLEEESTLGRLLESLRKVKLKDPIMVFAAPLDKRIIEKNKEVIRQFPDLNIHVFNNIFYDKIKTLAKEKRMSPLLREGINTHHYGGIRNLGLVLGALWKADNLIHLDDDEVIEDKKFFSKAIEGIGSKIGKKTLVGKTGYYIDENNSVFPPEDVPKWKNYWIKQKRMCRISNCIKSQKKRFHETSMALGGNMTINKELYMEVPFDPYITRGEDMDILLTSKYFGYNFMFDNHMAIRHLPPKRYVPYWLKLRRDAYRFIYQREKARFMKLDIESMDNYPKFFMKEDLEFKACVTSINYGKECLKHGKRKEFNESMMNVNLILKHAQLLAKHNVPKYFKFKEQWSKFIKHVHEEL